MLRVGLAFLLLVVEYTGLRHYLDVGVRVCPSLVLEPPRVNNPSAGRCGWLRR